MAMFRGRGEVKCARVQTPELQVPPDKVEDAAFLHCLLLHVLTEADKIAVKVLPPTRS